MNAKPLITVAAIAFGLPLFPAAILPSAHAVVLSEESHSQLPGFTAFPLPDNGVRITDTSLTGELSDPLKSFAKESGITLRATEVVYWSKGDKATRDMLINTLKGAGYDYKQLGEKKNDAANMIIFTAKQSGGSNTVAGYWIERKGQSTLVWGSSGTAKTPNANVQKDILPDSTAGDDAKPDKPTASGKEASTPEKVGRKTALPASLVGPTWSWTTIGGVNYVNQNGQMMEPSGMSSSYTFTRDGRYKFFFYVRQRTYNMVTESTTNHSGKVTFSGDHSFTVYPEKGTYKGNIGSRIIDRPMTAEERKPVTWYYEWRTENGKPQLYIGPNKSSARPFKKA